MSAVSDIMLEDCGGTRKKKEVEWAVDILPKKHSRVGCCNKTSRDLDRKVFLDAEFIVEVGLCLSCCLLLKKITGSVT